MAADRYFVTGRQKAEHSEMAQTVQYRKGLSSQNQCHRELVMAERVAGADPQDLGQNKRKYGYGHLLCQASWGKLITQKNRMTETEHGTCSPDMAAQQHTEIKGF